MRYEVVLIASNKHASARLTYVVGTPDGTKAGARALAMAKDHYTEYPKIEVLEVNEIP